MLRLAKDLVCAVADRCLRKKDTYYFLMVK